MGTSIIFLCRFQKYHHRLRSRHLHQEKEKQSVVIVQLYVGSILFVTIVFLSLIVWGLMAQYLWFENVGLPKMCIAKIFSLFVYFTKVFTNRRIISILLLISGILLLIFNVSYLDISNHKFP